MAEIILANLSDISGFSTNSVNVGGTSYAPTAAGLYYLTPGGAFSFNLPLVSALAVGSIVIVKDLTGLAATYNITIAGSGGQTIDGASTKVMSTNYACAMLVNNGTNWSVLS